MKYITQIKKVRKMENEDVKKFIVSNWKIYLLLMLPILILLILGAFILLIIFILLISWLTYEIVRKQIEDEEVLKKAQVAELTKDNNLDKWPRLISKEDLDILLKNQKSDKDGEK